MNWGNFFWIRRPAQQSAANNLSFFPKAKTFWDALDRPVFTQNKQPAANQTQTVANQEKLTLRQILLGIPIILLAFCGLAYVWSKHIQMETLQTTPDGVARITAEAQAIAVRSRAVDPQSCIEGAKVGIILLGCGTASTPPANQQQVTTPSASISVATDTTCPVVGTAKRGDIMFTIYGDQAGCVSVMSGNDRSVSLHKGNFKAQAEMVVRQKDCTTWDDISNDTVVDEGKTLSGCFRVTGNVNMKAV